MKYIVTGGAGFIGSHLVNRLLAFEKKVVVLDNLSTGRIENITDLLPKISFFNMDIANLSKMEEIFDKGDIIFHMAALPSVQRSIISPIKSNEVNINGTLNILTAAKNKRCKRVIFSSSSSIYGDTEKLPKSEDMLPNPKSPYALTKYTGEQYMKLFYTLYGLETISLRYFNVFGPRQDPNSQYSAVIPKFIKAIKEDVSPIIFGDGTQTRDFTYVDNVIDANILASKLESTAGEIINIASNKQIKLIDVLNLINTKLGKKIKPTFVKPRLGDIKHSYADITKAKELMGYSPKIAFEKGLFLTIDNWE